MYTSQQCDSYFTLSTSFFDFWFELDAVNMSTQILTCLLAADMRNNLATITQGNMDSLSGVCFVVYQTRTAFEVDSYPLSATGDQGTTCSAREKG